MYKVMHIFYNFFILFSHIYYTYVLVSSRKYNFAPICITGTGHPVFSYEYIFSICRFIC